MSFRIRLPPAVVRLACCIAFVAMAGAADTWIIRVAGFCDDPSLTRIPAANADAWGRMLISGTLTITSERVKGMYTNPDGSVNATLQATVTAQLDAAVREQPVFAGSFAWSTQDEAWHVQSVMQRLPVVRQFIFSHVDGGGMWTQSPTGDPIAALPAVSRQPGMPVVWLYRACETDVGARIGLHYFWTPVGDGALLRTRAMAVGQTGWNLAGDVATSGIPIRGFPVPGSFAGMWQARQTAPATPDSGTWAWYGSPSASWAFTDAHHVVREIVGYIDDGAHADMWYVTAMGAPDIVMAAAGAAQSAGLFSPAQPTTSYPSLAIDDNAGFTQRLRSWRTPLPTPSSLQSTKGGPWVVGRGSGGGLVYVDLCDPAVTITWTTPALDLPHDHDLFEGMQPTDNAVGRLFAAFGSDVGATNVLLTFRPSDIIGDVVVNVPNASLHAVEEIPLWAQQAMGLSGVTDTAHDRWNKALENLDNVPAPPVTEWKIPARHFKAGELDGRPPGIEKISGDLTWFDGIVQSTKEAESGQPLDGSPMDATAVTKAHGNVTAQIAKGPNVYNPASTDTSDPEITAARSKVAAAADPIEDLNRKSMQMEEVLGALQGGLVSRPGTRPDYGTWRPGMPVPKPQANSGMAGAVSDVATRMAQFMEGGMPQARSRGDYKKSLIWPAGTLDRDVVPPYTKETAPDPDSDAFVNVGDGNNPRVPLPSPVWYRAGMPTYDHDGDGDLDRFWSTDPFGPGYTHVRIRWQFMKMTASIRTGMSTTFQGMSSAMGFKAFNPASGTGDFYKQAAFSVSGIVMRPDGIMDREDLLFWGNDTDFKTDGKIPKNNWGMIAGIGAVGIALVVVGILMTPATGGVSLALIGAYMTIAGGAIAAGAMAYSTTMVMGGFASGLDVNYVYGPSLCNFLVKADDGVSIEQRHEDDAERNPSGSSTWIFRLVYTGPPQPIVMQNPGEIIPTNNTPQQRIYYATTDQPKNQTPIAYYGTMIAPTTIPEPGLSTCSDEADPRVIIAVSSDGRRRPVIDRIEYETSQTFENAEIDATTLSQYKSSNAGSGYSMPGFVPLTTVDPPRWITVYRRMVELYVNGAPYRTIPDATASGHYLDVTVTYPGFLYGTYPERIVAGPYAKAGEPGKTFATFESGSFLMTASINDDLKAADGTPLYDDKGKALIDVNDDGEPDNRDQVAETRNGRYIDPTTGDPVTDFAPRCVDFNHDGNLDAQDDAYAVQGMQPRFASTFKQFELEVDGNGRPVMMTEPNTGGEVPASGIRLLRAVSFEADPSIQPPDVDNEMVRPAAQNQDSWHWGVNNLIDASAVPGFSDGKSLAKLLLSPQVESMYDIMAANLTAIHNDLSVRVQTSYTTASDIMFAGTAVSSTLALASAGASAYAWYMGEVASSAFSAAWSSLLEGQVGAAVMSGVEGVEAGTAAAEASQAASSFSAGASSIGIGTLSIAFGAMVTYVAVTAMTNNDTNPIESGDEGRMPWTVTKYGPWKNGGGVILNGVEVSTDGGLSAFLGIDGSIPMISSVGSSLKDVSGGLIELIVHDDPTLVRPDMRGTDMYWMGQATQYRHWNRSSFPPQLDWDTVRQADIIPSPEGYDRRFDDINFSGDRLYRCDAGFGIYAHQGNLVRFFNELQQSIILAQKWSYEFTTPPSRMVRQFWNNNDPGSPLLNSIRPQRMPYEGGGVASSIDGSLTAFSVDQQAFFDRVTSMKVGSTVADVMGAAADPFAFETQNTYIDNVVFRRAYLKDHAYYIFSAMRGREWEVEMARRMPAHVRLVCVEWEDRDEVRERFMRWGRPVEFADNPRKALVVGGAVVDPHLIDTGVFGPENLMELDLYNEIARMYFGVDPAPFIKVDDRMTEVEQGDSVLIRTAKFVMDAFIGEKDAGEDDGTRTLSRLTRTGRTTGYFPYLAWMNDGKPAVLVDRRQKTVTYKSGEGHAANDVQRVVDWDATINTAKDGRIFRLLFDDSTGANPKVTLRPVATTSEAVRIDMLEFRHPMLTYYHDETSAIYVHYGINCNPATTFGRWSEHMPPDAIEELDPEQKRRQVFERDIASDDCKLQNIFAQLFPESYAAYQSFLQMRDPPPAVPDPGPEPRETGPPVYDGPAQPVLPVEPPEPVQPDCRLPLVMANNPFFGYNAKSSTDRIEDYETRFRIVRQGPGYTYATLRRTDQYVDGWFRAAGYYPAPGGMPGSATIDQYINGGIPGGNNYVTWDGLFVAPVTASYQFHCSSDDSHYVWMDGVGIQSGAWNWHATSSSNSGVYTLEAGRAYSMRVVVHNHGGPGDCYFYVRSNTGSGWSGWSYVAAKRRTTPSEQQGVPDLALADVRAKIARIEELRNHLANPYLTLAAADITASTQELNVLTAALQIRSSGAACWEWNMDFTPSLWSKIQTSAPFYGNEFWAGSSLSCNVWKPSTNKVLKAVGDIADGIVAPVPSIGELVGFSDLGMAIQSSYPAWPSMVPHADQRYAYVPTWTIPGIPGTEPAIVAETAGNAAGTAWADRHSVAQIQLVDGQFKAVSTLKPWTPDDLQPNGMSGPFHTYAFTPFVEVEIRRSTRVFIDTKGQGLQVTYRDPTGAVFTLDTGTNNQPLDEVDFDDNYLVITPYKERRFVIRCDIPGTWRFQAVPVYLDYDWVDWCEDGGGNANESTIHLGFDDITICNFMTPKLRHYTSKNAFLKLLRVQQEPLDAYCAEAWEEYDHGLWAYNDYWARALPQFDIDYQRWETAIDDYVDRRAAWQEESALFAQRMADWQVRKTAYDRYVAQMDDWRKRKAAADAFIAARDWWVGQIRTEARIPGVMWSNHQLQPTGYDVNMADQMPSTPIWQGYKYMIADAGSDGKISLDLVRGYHRLGTQVVWSDAGGNPNAGMPVVGPSDAGFGTGTTTVDGSRSAVGLKALGLGWTTLIVPIEDRAVRMTLSQLSGCM